MERKELEVSRDGAELWASGEILTDKRAMERKVGGELAKITNEQLIPFKGYLKLTLWRGLIFLLVNAALRPIFNLIKPSDIYEIIALFTIQIILNILYFLFRIRHDDSEKIDFHTTLLDISFPYAIYKIWSARIIFRQAAAELHCEAISGCIELKSLKKAFLERVTLIKERAEALALDKKLESEAERRRMLEQIETI